MLGIGTKTSLAFLLIVKCLDILLKFCTYLAIDMAWRTDMSAGVSWA